MTGWVGWWVDERAGEWAGGWKGGWLETASQHSNVRFALYSTICIAIAVRACTATMHPIHVVFLSGGMKLKQLAFVSSLVMRSVAHTFCSCRISFNHMACVLRCPSAYMRGRKFLWLARQVEVTTYVQKILLKRRSN